MTKEKNLIFKILVFLQEINQIRLNIKNKIMLKIKAIMMNFKRQIDNQDQNLETNYNKKFTTNFPQSPKI